VLDEGYRTADLAQGRPTVSTSEMGRQVVKAIKHAATKHAQNGKSHGPNERTA
jgi:hypothetical protein